MHLALFSDWTHLPTSGKLAELSALACLAGVLLCLVSMVAHWVASYRPGVRQALFRMPLAAMVVNLALLCAWIPFKWGEVNHFPSQTMAEVLVMFTVALAASMVVLHFALGLTRRGHGWAILVDALHLVVFGGIWLVLWHVSTLVTAQRDLPPALQSYWFPPHLSALIFSYATLGIAGAICMVYFSTRYWAAAFTRGRAQGSAMLIATLVATGLLFAGLRGGAPLWLTVLGPLVVAVGAVVLVPRLLPNAAAGSPAGRLQSGMFLMLTLVPFAQVVTLPVLAVTGLVFLVLDLVRNLPRAETIVGLERELDAVSYRAFAVGIPFLTAGLFMGAFWAQEAWANYWGWDSKENSALITWLIYVIYIHLRMLGGYRGAKAMSVLMGGALSIFITFQVFGYLPDSQKSLHRYTDDGVQPQEGNMGMETRADEQEARR